MMKSRHVNEALSVAKPVRQLARSPGFVGDRGSDVEGKKSRLQGKSRDRWSQVEGEMSRLKFQGLHGGFIVPKHDLFLLVLIG